MLACVSCYAPTYAASRAEKDAFFDMLQQALDDVPSREPFVMFRDLNACVGSRLGTGDEWGRVKSMKQARNYSLSSPLTRLPYVARGLRRRRSTSKSGSTLDLKGGTALTMPS